jgi:hypothetical protein
VQLNQDEISLLLTFGVDEECVKVLIGAINISDETAGLVLDLISNDMNRLIKFKIQNKNLPYDAYASIDQVVDLLKRGKATFINWFKETIKEYEEIINGLNELRLFTHVQTEVADNLLVKCNFDGDIEKIDIKLKYYREKVARIHSYLTARCIN